MYTQCPECQTIYRVTPQVLAQAAGSVVCGCCTAVFDALRTLTEKLPVGPDHHFETHAHSRDLPRLDVASIHPDQASVAGSDVQTDWLEASKPVPEPRAPSVAPRLATPEFARTVRTFSAQGKWPWRIGVALLLPLLGAQIAYAQRHELLRSTVTRPWLERACNVLHCRLPLAHDSDGLVLLSRDVRPHPSVPNALIISATLRNVTGQRLAFPTVEITLADLDEHRIAMRRFAPSEYIGDAHTIAAGLAAGAASSLVFEVVDPGKNAVAYEFRFL